jgi:hypothetical protein
MPRDSRSLTAETVHTCHEARGLRPLRSSSDFAASRAFVLAATVHGHTDEQASSLDIGRGCGAL